VITAAPAVMVAVFVAFAISGDRTPEEFGVGLAAGVLLDPLVIRLMLLPAVLQLLGRTTWALPTWLDRRMPNVAIEPERPPAAAKPRAGTQAGLRTPAVPQPLPAHPLSGWGGTAVAPRARRPADAPLTAFFRPTPRAGPVRSLP
jgi:hypothetical protein